MKVLIIDDEPNVREGLKLIVPWEELGFSICGEGKDGKDGLDQIMLLHPDLVLIDIKMPGMSGINVIEEAIKQGFKGKFIITTGYSDFEYAKKAICLGVKSYVLKPIDEDELISEVKRLKQELKEASEIKNKLDVGEDYLRSQELLHLLTCHYDELVAKEEGLKARSQEYENYYLVVIKLFTQAHQLVTLFEEIKYYLNCKDMECMLFNNEIIILDKAKQRRQELLESLHDKLMQLYGIKSIFAISQMTEGIEKVHSTYIKVRDLLELHFLFPEQYILEETDKKQECLEIEEAERLSNQLYRLIQVSDLSKIKETLESLKGQLKMRRLSIKKTISLCTQVILRCIQLIEGQYKTHHIEMPKGEVVIEAIYKSSNIEELIDYMYKELEVFCKQIQQKAPENTMDKIIYYINNNYNKEIKLETLAELFNYNSAYLGKSFKNYTGEGFNIYIDRLRINKAKELLLNEELKVYEISKAVGYKHIDYFHSKFKKYVGTSPLEYRKSKRGN